MNTDNQQLDSIETSELTIATGGGWLGGAIKLAEKAAPLVKKAVPFVEHTAVPFVAHKALPFLGHTAVEAAKWTGIPAAAGAGAAWVRHELGK